MLNFRKHENFNTPYEEVEEETLPRAGKSGDREHDDFVVSMFLYEVDEELLQPLLIFVRYLTVRQKDANRFGHIQ